MSGAGNVAIYAIQKAQQLGAKPVTCSDSTGWIYDPEGIDVSLLKEVKEVKRARLTEYAAARPGAQYHECAPGSNVWTVKCDIALPCATQNELNLEDAKNLVEWVGAYYKGGNQYELKYRGDPILDTNDLSYLESRYVEDLMVRLEDVGLNFSGALSGTLVARRYM